MRIQRNRIGSKGLPCIGKLVKGSPATREGRKITKSGSNLDYFRFASQDEGLVRQFQELYGDKPTSVPVRLTMPTTQLACEVWNEEWSGAGLKRRCDGEYIVDPTLRNTSTGTPCIQETGGSCACKPILRMPVYLDRFNRLAVVLVESHSGHDCNRIREQLSALEALLRMSGADLTSVPLLLSRVFQVISAPVSEKGPDGKWRVTENREQKKESLLQIELDPTWAAYNMRRLAATQPQQLLGGSVSLLPEPDPVILPPEPETEEAEFAVIVDPDPAPPQMTKTEMQTAIKTSATAAGIPSDELRIHLAEGFGVRTSKDLDPDKYSLILDWIQQWQPAAETAEQPVTQVPF